MRAVSLLLLLALVASLAQCTVLITGASQIQAASVTFNGAGAADTATITNSIIVAGASGSDVSFNNYGLVTINTNSLIQADRNINLNNGIVQIAISASTLQTNHSTASQINLQPSSLAGSTIVSSTINAGQPTDTTGVINVQLTTISGASTLSADVINTASVAVTGVLGTPVAVNARIWNVNRNFLSWVSFTQYGYGTLVNGNGVLFSNSGPNIPGQALNTVNSVQSSSFAFSTNANTVFFPDATTSALPGRLSLTWPGNSGDVELDVVVTQPLYVSGGNVFHVYRDTTNFGNYQNNNVNFANIQMGGSLNANCLYLNYPDNRQIHVYTDCYNCLQFLPAATGGNYYNDNPAFARYCRATSKLVLQPSASVINGVSFVPTFTFLLTHTWTIAFPGEDTQGNIRVTNSDFFSSFLSNRQVQLVSVNDAGPLRTVVYQITAQAICDGLVTLNYRGTIGSNGNNQYRRGFDFASASAIYAGCLTSQFCL